MADLTFGARNIVIPYCPMADSSNKDKVCKHAGSDACETCCKINGKYSDYEAAA